MNDDMQRLLTELLGEKILSNQECIDSYASNRSFLAWQDLGDVKEALVREELWGEFLRYSFNSENSDEPPNMFPDGDVSFYDEDFIGWLFRPTDEKGNVHFCKLVAEFLEKFVKQN